MISFITNYIKCSRLIGRTIYLEGDSENCCGWESSGREIDIKKLTPIHVYFSVYDTRCNFIKNDKLTHSDFLKLVEGVF